MPPLPPRGTGVVIWVIRHRRSLSNPIIRRHCHEPLPRRVPMIERRPFNKLAGEDRGWLKAKHHFSFADHDDPARTGWGSLRIWNDDEIAPNTGFPPHPHANMEIIPYVREHAGTHTD